MRAEAVGSCATGEREPDTGPVTHNRVMATIYVLRGSDSPLQNNQFHFRDAISAVHPSGQLSTSGL